MSENIIKGITDILFNKLKINRNVLTEKNYDQPLTGKVFHLSGIDLVYLFLFVQERFHIKIKQEALTDYRFNTINKIADIVKEYRVTTNE